MFTVISAFEISVKCERAFSIHKIKRSLFFSKILQKPNFIFIKIIFKENHAKTIIEPKIQKENARTGS